MISKVNDPQERFIWVHNVWALNHPMQAQEMFTRAAQTPLKLKSSKSPTRSRSEPRNRGEEWRKCWWKLCEWHKSFRRSQGFWPWPNRFSPPLKAGRNRWGLWYHGCRYCFDASCMSLSTLPTGWRGRIPMYSGHRFTLEPCRLLSHIGMPKLLQFPSRWDQLYGWECPCVHLLHVSSCCCSCSADFLPIAIVLLVRKKTVVIPSPAVETHAWTWICFCNDSFCPTIRTTVVQLCFIAAFFLEQLWYRTLIILIPEYNI